MDLVALLPLLIILGAFMFFASRRQKKAMQKTIDLHDSLKVGDRVHTTSGLQGEIKAINDDNVRARDRARRRDDLDEARRAGSHRSTDDEFDDDVDDAAGEPESTATEITDSTGPEPTELTTDSRGLSTATYPLRC